MDKDKLLKLIKERETKDWIIYGGAAILVIVAVLYATRGVKAEIKQVDADNNIIFSSGTKHGDLKTYFTNHVKKELTEQSQKVNDVSQKLEEDLKSKDKRLEDLENANTRLNEQVELLLSKLENISNATGNTLSKSGYGRVQDDFDPNVIEPSSGHYNGSNSNFKDSAIGVDDIELVSAKLQQDKPTFKDINTYLPAGTHIRGVIVGGVDAHTEVYGENNTRVVTIRLVDGGDIPNGFKGDMKNCTLLASAWGNASSERVAMRGERLTCVSKVGKVLETKIIATVYGGDGRQDVRGRMVYPEGKLLERAFLAGSLSGIGGGIAQSFTSQSISPLGATSVIPNQDVFKYGAAQGVGKGLDKLADYYIKRAEQLQPIIQVGSGTQVDVVIQKGFYLDGHDYQEESNGTPASPFSKSSQDNNADIEAKIVMANIKETM
jgi:conjugal transfer pilus assembly protein TraB